MLHLPALNQTWQIHYIKTDTKKLRLLSRPAKELVLFGGIDDAALCKEMLNQWVKMQAKIYLPKRLEEISKQINLPYKKVTIRGQTTRWGSCTSDKSISLNYKLMYLPAHLVTHILIHELCHTVHMNHSARFWRLVASFDAQWKKHVQEIKRLNLAAILPNNGRC